MFVKYCFWEEKCRICFNYPWKWFVFRDSFLIYRQVCCLHQFKVIYLNTVNPHFNFMLGLANSGNINQINALFKSLDLSLCRSIYLLFHFSCQVPKTSNGIISGELCFERPPSILVPLKVHTPPKGYQLYMTCAVRGCPTPSVSWYLDNVCINSDNNYYITNSFGVCSLYILSVRAKDSGEYKVVAVNPLGKAECSTKLVVKGKSNKR